MARPNLNHVVKAILDCSSRQGIFLPSELRIYLAPRFPRTKVPSQLSAQIQPHLILLRSNEIIALCNSHQLRNRPHKIINRTRLDELAKDPNCSLPRIGLVNEDISGRSDEDDYTESDSEERVSGIEKRLAAIEDALAGIEHLVQSSIEATPWARDISRRISIIENDCDIIGQHLTDVKNNVEDIELKLNKFIPAMNDGGVDNHNPGVTQNNWSSRINEDSTVTWAEYFFDNPNCQSHSSKNEFFLGAFFSDVERNDRNVVYERLSGNQDLIAQFRNLTKYLAHLVPNGAFNCPGFNMNGPAPILTVGRTIARNGRFGSSIIIVVYFRENDGILYQGNFQEVPAGFHIYVKELGEDMENQDEFLFDGYDPRNDPLPPLPYKRLKHQIQFKNNELVFLTPSCKNALKSVCFNLKDQINNVGQNANFYNRVRPDGIPRYSPVYPKFIREPGPPID